jgi:hypothetical protein
VAGDVGQPQSSRVRNQLAEGTASSGQGTDPNTRGLVDPQREESRQFAAGLIEHPERRVSRRREVTGRLQHPAEHKVDVELAEHASRERQDRPRAVVHDQSARVLRRGSHAAEGTVVPSRGAADREVEGCWLQHLPHDRARFERADPGPAPDRTHRLKLRPRHPRGHARRRLGNLASAHEAINPSDRGRGERRAAVGAARLSASCSSSTLHPELVAADAARRHRLCDATGRFA